MAPLLILYIFFFFFSLFSTSTTSLRTCENWCGGGPNSPDIRFPFGINGTACYYPGFNLTCNNNNGHFPLATLTLPHSTANFTVTSINYQSQTIRFRDPDGCLPRLFLNRSFDLSSSRFSPDFFYPFAFLNCSSSFLPRESATPFRIVPCLGGVNGTVVALPASGPYDEEFVGNCTVIEREVWVPMPWLRGDMETRLVWRLPECEECENKGGTCAFDGEPNDLRVGCSNLPNKIGLPRSAKYGLILGVGIPGLLCVIGTTCFIFGKIKEYRNRSHHRHHSNTQFNDTVSSQPNIFLSGLDGPTIESYPKIQLGESRRLPKPNDNTCPICLCEYEPKDILRTIPECNHYFHVDCIDEWLKMNATCPLCRNSPESSSITTTLSLSSSSSSLSPP